MDSVLQKFRWHDMTIYRKSGLEAQLQTALHVNNPQYVVYSYSAYETNPWMRTLIQCTYMPVGQIEWNTSCAKSWVFVEWWFTEVKKYWRRVYFNLGLQIQQSTVCNMYTTAMILTSMLNCLYPNKIAQFFVSNHLLWVSILAVVILPNYLL